MGFDLGYVQPCIMRSIYYFCGFFINFNVVLIKYVISSFTYVKEYGKGNCNCHVFLQYLNAPQLDNCQHTFSLYIWHQDKLNL